MTGGAQQALRRTMEIYSNTTRFALACNQSTKIIEPIQSRCAVLRYTKLTDAQVLSRLLEICKRENASKLDIFNSVQSLLILFWHSIGQIQRWRFGSTHIYSRWRYATSNQQSAIHTLRVWICECWKCLQSMRPASSSISTTYPPKLCRRQRNRGWQINERTLRFWLCFIEYYHHCLPSNQVFW